MARSEAQKSAEKKYGKKRAERSKVWAGVVYPDSAPEDWIDRLRSLMVDAFVSPLHDKDCNADGEVKKAHWHVLLMFGSMKTQEQAREAMEQFGCTVSPERVRNMRGYARYLCHLDNPEKYQYNQADVIAVGGADYLSAIGLPTDKYEMLMQMMNFCDENKIYGYATLVRYARSNRPDWFRCLADNGTVMMKEYLKSARWEDQVNSRIEREARGEGGSK